MLTRHVVCILGLLLGPSAMAATAQAPSDIVTAIYARQVAESKTDVPGIAFAETSVRTRYFSKGLARLIKAAENGPGMGDGFNFDPLMNGEQGEIRKLDVKTERADAGTAVVSAKFLNHGKTIIVTYDLVRESGGWRVDDIRGFTGPDAWSVRKMLGSTTGQK